MHRLRGTTALLASAATLLVFSVGRSPGAAGVLRRDPRPHRLVVRRLHLRQHQDRRRPTPTDTPRARPIKHPLGYDIKIDTPLDWMGVTDHSEYVGTVALANTPGSDISKLPIAEKLIVHDRRPTSSESTCGSATR